MKSALRDYPELQGFFDFSEFNPLQKQCLPKIMRTQNNMIVSAPTSSGKTAIFEMAIIKYRQFPSPMCLYLAPMKSLCHQKFMDWSNKFSKILSVAEVTGDSLENGNERFFSFHIAVGTPEKIDYLSRQNLDYLKKIKLLLIDQIHMLNYQERGATLEAIVSRIMSLNSNVRIIAVSATIPNIYEVSQWLKCPPSTVCVFGQQYRPVKIKTVVLGFAHSGNPFTFQRILNFKLLETIRLYSDKKGTLIFCPTQKGSQQACQQIISQMRERQFIDNDKQLMSLIQAAKQVSNAKLQSMIPQGVAFHNASLTYQDRNIVEKLFLELKVKVLCTTSTLSMGINLPARLVVIKSTQCYKGSMKGYQQYTRIQIEQMMGRAGRPPFDDEGTVVIMTQKSNYNRYSSKLQLQNLQSQLFNHMLEHINAQISLGSILSLEDVQSYFFNSFCFIRMKQSPKTYGIQGNVEEFVRKNCLRAVKALADQNVINFSEDSHKVSPRPLSISISRNAVEVRSITSISHKASQLETQRQYLMAICSCEQIGKYTSKLEERRVLKQLNEKNKFVLKEAISNSERKAFVLIQAELSKIPIQFWELRRQASEILIMLRRLNNCVKTLGFEIKNFWVYYWSVRYQKYFSQKYWEKAEKSVMLQLKGLDDRSKQLYLNGVRSMQTLESALQMKNWLQKDSSTAGNIKQLEHYQAGIRINTQKDPQNGSISVKVTAVYDFSGKYKGVTVCVGDSHNNLYHYKYLHQNCKQNVIYFPKGSQEEFKIGVIKQGIIGFDQFYKLKGQRLFKYDPQEAEIRASANRKSLDNGKKQSQLAFKERKSTSLEDVKKQVVLSDKKMQSDETIKKDPFSSDRFDRDHQLTRNISNKIKKSSQLQLPQKYRIRQPLVKQSQNDEYLRKEVKRQSEGRFKDLKEYNWKPGFEKIEESSSQSQEKKRKLKLVQSKDKNGNFFSRFAFQGQKKIKQEENEETNKNREENFGRKQEKGKGWDGDVFDYFYNLF